MAENICNQCGFPLDSRTHLEGLGGIHERPVATVEQTTVDSAAVVEAVIEATASQGTPPEPSPRPARRSRKK